MQMTSRSFSSFFSFARMSFLFYLRLDMFANSVLALKGRGGRGGNLKPLLVIAAVTGAYNIAGT